MAISIAEKFASRPPTDVKFFKGNLGLYATGGISLLAADVGLRNLHAVIVIGAADATRRYAYDTATGKVVAYVTSTGAEVANAVDLSAVPFDFIVFGS